MRADWFFAPYDDRQSPPPEAATTNYKVAALKGGCVLLRPLKFERASKDVDRLER